MDDDRKEVMVARMKRRRPVTQHHKEYPRNGEQYEIEHRHPPEKR